MTCPTCKTDSGITDSVSSGGLVTREKCGDAWHAARLASWPFDPNPPKLIPAENGFIYCRTCEKSQPASGHECGAPLIPAAWLIEVGEFLARAEFAESLLCATVFGHGLAYGTCRCDFCSIIRDAARGGGR